MKIENLKIDFPTKEIVINSEKVIIKQYLSTADKIDIIRAIQDLCFNEEIINQPKLDALFNVFIALNYTDIEFDSREVDELLKLYDYFESKGYMGIIINTIPKVEYDALVGYLNETIDDFNRYKTSITGALGSLVASLPTLMEQISEISKEIDIESLQTLTEIYTNMNN